MVSTLAWATVSSTNGTALPGIEQQLIRLGRTNRPGALELKPLTHLVAKYPGLRASVDLHEDGGRADEQHQQVRDAQVGEEDVCRVAHILRLHNHDGHLQRSLIWDLAILTSSPRATTWC